MPKNAGMGGNKRKKGKKLVQEDRELRYKEESEEYAQIIKILGDGRFQCKCADGVERIAHVRGKMRKRTWLANGDIILVSLREFEPEKCDVVEKYKEKEIAKLKKSGEIPESMVLPSSSEAENKDDGDADILFEEHDEEVISKKKENSSGFDIESENEEENEEDENQEKKEEKKEDNKEKEEDKEDEKDEDEEEKEKEKEKEKKSKRDKKEKDRKRKNNRDKKRGEKEDDDKGFNIDDI
jgi:translation initiation factor 1A